MSQGNNKELETVRRAIHSTSDSIQDIGINHRRAHIGVVQRFLTSPDVITKRDRFESDLSRPSLFIRGGKGGQ